MVITSKPATHWLSEDGTKHLSLEGAVRFGLIRDLRNFLSTTRPSSSSEHSIASWMADNAAAIRGILNQPIIERQQDETDSSRYDPRMA